MFINIIFILLVITFFQESLLFLLYEYLHAIVDIALFLFLERAGFPSLDSPVSMIFYSAKLPVMLSYFQP